MGIGFAYRRVGEKRIVRPVSLLTTGTSGIATCLADGFSPAKGR